MTLWLTRNYSMATFNRKQIELTSERCIWMWSRLANPCAMGNRWGRRRWVGGSRQVVRNKLTRRSDKRRWISVIPEYHQSTVDIIHHLPQKFHCRRYSHCTNGDENGNNISPPSVLIPKPITIGPPLFPPKNDATPPSRLNQRPTTRLQLCQSVVVLIHKSCS